MAIFITITSILAITALVWTFNKISPFYICPICAGVSGTWLWMLIGVLTNNLQLTTYSLVIAILMGGSVVGIMYQLEKKRGELPLIWKTIFVVSGFLIVYALVSGWLAVGFFTVAFFAAFSILVLQKNGIQRPEKKSQVKELEEKMKNCC